VTGPWLPKREIKKDSRSAGGGREHESEWLKKSRKTSRGTLTHWPREGGRGTKRAKKLALEEESRQFSAEIALPRST